MLEKIFDIDSLALELEKRRIRGKKIVHCHGVFDLLHVGHIRYFEEAKSMGNILVVTVTPDRYVNKGPNRPAFTEGLRSEAIAALQIVDYVGINKWPTAIETIKALKPNIYVKGPDYKDPSNDLTGNIKLEKDAVKSIGGVIKFTSGIMFSSSHLINQNLSKFTKEQSKFLDQLKEKYTMDLIQQFIEKLKKLKVLLVGETIIDEYIFCDAIGKSGKEPILVLKKLNIEKYPGGILAVANHVSEFCKNAKIVSYLGERDAREEFIRENLKSNIELDYIKKKNSPTILKSRFLDAYTNMKMLGVYDINDSLVDKNEEANLFSKLEKCIRDYDVVIIVDYGHGLITPKIIQLLTEKSRFLVVNTQVNAANIGFHTISKYEQAHYVCIHEGELRHDYRSRIRDVKDLTKNLYLRMKPDVIVITSGKTGSLAYNNKEGFTTCPAFATKVADRIGAGDTLYAITSLCFAAGIPTDITLFIGNLAAAEAIATTGTGFSLNKVKLLKSIDTLLK